MKKLILPLVGFSLVVFALCGFMAAMKAGFERDEWRRQSERALVNLAEAQAGFQRATADRTLMERQLIAQDGQIDRLQILAFATGAVTTEVLTRLGAPPEVFNGMMDEYRTKRSVTEALRWAKEKSATIPAPASNREGPLTPALSPKGAREVLADGHRAARREPSPYRWRGNEETISAGSPGG